LWSPEDDAALHQTRQQTGCRPISTTYLAGSASFCRGLE
jgi:hypothetical protein